MLPGRIANRLVIWEAFDADDIMTRAAGSLYERTIPDEERIPWQWIRRAVASRTRPEPTPGRGWIKHLLLAAPAERTTDPDALAGLAYGAFIPNYGGYLSYVAVADWARGRGVGTRLFEQFFRQLALDAGGTGCDLPFVIWESRRPEASSADWDLWTARTRLFDRVGGLWVEGIDFQSPSFAPDRGQDAAVPLQLFLKPIDTPAAAFDAERLKEVAAGLHREVYRNEPGSPLFDRTFPPGCQPRLRPARCAARVTAGKV